MLKVVRCPTCQVKVSWKNNPPRPFYFGRCRSIKFGAWAEGKYRIPREELDRESKSENGDDEEGSP